MKELTLKALPSYTVTRRNAEKLVLRCPRVAISALALPLSGIGLELFKEVSSSLLKLL
jgi:hypothetical protein